MWAIFILLLFAVGPLFSDELRSQPWAWVAMGVCWLALIGLVWREWAEMQHLRR